MPRSRAAFTLIELLVVLAILTALLLIAVPAVRGMMDQDRTNAAARTVMSKIILARSHATTDRKVRGIRLERSQNDPRICTSLLLVGSAGTYDADLTDIRVITGDPTTTGDDYWRLSGTFKRFADRGLIKVGTHVEIPAGSGDWYVLSNRDFDPNNGHLSIAGHYKRSEWGDYTDPSGQAGEYIVTHHWDPSLPTPLQESISARIELGATALDEAVSLPPGTAIDLDASRVPPEWRTGGVWDIMFDSNGMVGKGNGIISLYVTTLQDVGLTRNLFADHPANGGARTPPIVPANYPKVPTQTPYLVTVQCYTGTCTSNDVNFTDGDSDQQADDPFSYARSAMERN